MPRHLKVPGVERYAPALSHARTRERVQALCAQALQKACA